MCNYVFLYFLIKSHDGLVGLLKNLDISKHSPEMRKNFQSSCSFFLISGAVFATPKFKKVFQQNVKIDVCYSIKTVLVDTKHKFFFSRTSNFEDQFVYHSNQSFTMFFTMRDCKIYDNPL